jgi:saccharopine dehydrogenase-like NADP-dependent oxidoreductase
MAHAKVLVLGAGLQGRAVVHDLLAGPEGPVGEVVAADVDAARAASALVPGDAARPGLSVVAVDAAQATALRALLDGHRPDVVVCMLPPRLAPAAARLALEAGAHYVSTSYTGALAGLDGLARDRGLAVLPEMGLDPGIDLVMGRAAVDELDEVRGLDAFGGGVPAPEHADANPLRYMITWTFEGVLAAYQREARLLRAGREVVIPPTEIFAPQNVQLLDVPGVGRLEAYPNGDAPSYATLFGLGPAVADMGRYSLRWPGHSAFWYALSRLGLLDAAPLEIQSAAGPARISPRQFLARHLEPRLQYGPRERDLIVLRVRATGTRGGAPAEVVYDAVDARDLDTGLFAMNRTVGFTASLGARMVLDGTIAGRGVLSPARDVPPAALFRALAARGIVVRRTS